MEPRERGFPQVRGDLQPRRQRPALDDGPSRQRGEERFHGKFEQKTGRRRRCGDGDHPREAAQDVSTPRSSGASRLPPEPPNIRRPVDGPMPPAATSPGAADGWAGLNCSSCAATGNDGCACVGNRSACCTADHAAARSDRAPFDVGAWSTGTAVDGCSGAGRCRPGTVVGCARVNRCRRSRSPWRPSGRTTGAASVPTAPSPAPPPYAAPAAAGAGLLALAGEAPGEHKSILRRAEKLLRRESHPGLLAKYNELVTAINTGQSADELDDLSDELENLYHDSREKSPA